MSMRMDRSSPRGARARILFAVVVCLLPAAARADDVRTWTEAYLDPSLGGPAVAAATDIVRFGNLELDLTGARLHPVVVFGTVSGVFIEGPASFRYHDDDPKAESLWRYNCDESSRYEVDEEGFIGDEIEHALVMLSDGAAELLGEAPGRAVDPPEETVKEFREHVRRWSRDWRTGYVELMPQARVEPPSEPVAVLEIVARKHDVFLVRDPMRHADERLSVLRDLRIDLPGLEDTRYTRRLATRPIGRGRVDPRPFRYELIGLDALIVNPEGRAAQIGLRERVRATAPVRVLSFYLSDWFLGTTGGSGIPDSLQYRLLAVADGQGRELPWRNQGGDLLVELPAPLAAGAEMDLGFYLEGDVLYNPGNDSYWELSGAWYPRTPVWAQEKFAYHAVVKAASGFTPFSNGRTVRRWEEDGLTCAEFEESFPVDNAVVLAGKYRTRSYSQDGLTVNVSSYVFDNESSCRTIAKLVRGCIEFYRPLLGDFPYPEINVVEIHSLGWAMAPDAMVYVTQEAFTPGQHHEYSTGINRRVAHEVAHAWWGHVGKVGEPEDQWLGEATADYYSAVAMGALIGKREADRATREWELGAAEAEDVTSVHLANFVSGEDSGRIRQQLLYCKGPLVLDALRRETGDEAFFTIMKSLLASFRGSAVRTRDLIAITEQVTGREWDEWFDRYLFGLETPERD